MQLRIVLLSIAFVVGILIYPAALSAYDDMKKYGLTLKRIAFHLLKLLAMMVIFSLFVFYSVFYGREQ
jgi:hypothetical protein